MMRLFKKFKKYALICYVVHAERVAYCDTFNSLKNAKKKLNEFVKYDYDCEKKYANENGYDIYFKLEDECAVLERETPEGTWIWTWEIKKCNEHDWTYCDALCECFYDFIDKFKKNDNK